MIWGSIRSRGVKVSRERVCSALQSIDPLSRALRWPAGLTRRQPYSVAGPNSWVIFVNSLFPVTHPHPLQTTASIIIIESACYESH